jgi:hypothetical protein
MNVRQKCRDWITIKLQSHQRPSLPAEARSLMGGPTDGTGAVLAFNAANCYPRLLQIQGCSKFYFQHTHLCAVWALCHLARVSAA